MTPTSRIIPLPARDARLRAAAPDSRIIPFPTHRARLRAAIPLVRTVAFAALAAASAALALFGGGAEWQPPTDLELLSLLGE